MSRTWILFAFISHSLADIDIAIIGGGIGGASSAFFLNEMKPNSFKIDLYEADKIGGRLATVEFKGHHYENGGSIIHSKNRYMRSFVEKFGLEMKELCPASFGIFNGTEMLFKSSYSDYITAFKLWWRYGGNDVFRLNSYTSEMLHSFQRIYKLSKLSSYPCNTTFELLSHVDNDLMSLVKFSTFEGFVKQDISERFVQEFIACIIRCNYCQSLNIHAFVGSVAVAGAGADLWSVKGGNWQVAQKLITASGATFINSRVASVSTIKNDQKVLVSTGSKSKMYDYAIIAFPLTNANPIEFFGFESDRTLYDEYHLTVCTLLKGKINKQFFSTFGDALPNTLLFTDKFYFNAIAKINPVDGSCANFIWKIFSDSELTDFQLKQTFLTYSIISVKNWLAYPKYKNTAINKSFYTFNNSANVFYVNAIESLASAMEMSAIGAHNVASLIVKRIDNTTDVGYFSSAPFHDEF